MDAYDPNTNTWTRKHDMPSAFPDTHAAVVKDPNGHVFWFIGGFLGSFTHDSTGAHGPPGTALVYKYDAATDTWTKGPSLPSARAAGGAGIVNNKIYYFGGADVTRNNDKGDTYMLDLNNGLTNYTYTGYMQPLNGITPQRLVQEKLLPTTLMSTTVRPSDFRRGVMELQIPVTANALWEQAWQRVKSA